MPREVASHGGKLVIVNLQKTPLDHMANIRVFARTDDFMKSLMKHLGIEIPEWRLIRRMSISNKYNEEVTII
jgi:hypothetical protein